MHGTLFHSVRALTLLIFGSLFSKGFMAGNPEDYSLPLKVLYYVIVIILEILSVAIAALVVAVMIKTVNWLFDMLWPT